MNIHIYVYIHIYKLFLKRKPLKSRSIALPQPHSILCLFQLDTPILFHRYGDTNCPLHIFPNPEITLRKIIESYNEIHAYRFLHLETWRGIELGASELPNPSL